jgi:hypothetical protein
MLLYFVRVTKGSIFQVTTIPVVCGLGNFPRFTAISLCILGVKNPRRIGLQQMRKVAVLPKSTNYRFLEKTFD